MTLSDAFGKLTVLQHRWCYQETSSRLVRQPLKGSAVNRGRFDWRQWKRLVPAGRSARDRTCYGDAKERPDVTWCTAVMQNFVCLTACTGFAEDSYQWRLTRTSVKWSLNFARKISRAAYVELYQVGQTTMLHDLSNVETVYHRHSEIWHWLLSGSYNMK